jgi:hypothetical protein
MACAFPVSPIAAEFHVCMLRTAIVPALVGLLLRDRRQQLAPDIHGKRNFRQNHRSAVASWHRCNAPLTISDRDHQPTPL